MQAKMVQRITLAPEYHPDIKGITIRMHPGFRRMLSLRWASAVQWGDSAWRPHPQKLTLCTIPTDSAPLLFHARRSRRFVSPKTRRRNLKVGPVVPGAQRCCAPTKAEASGSLLFHAKRPRESRFSLILEKADPSLWSGRQRPFLWDISTISVMKTTPAIETLIG